MQENRLAKDEIRLKQASLIMRALIDTFGLPMLLDAVASVVSDAEISCRLQAAAEAERKAVQYGLADR